MTVPRVGQAGVQCGDLSWLYVLYTVLVLVTVAGCCLAVDTHAVAAALVR